MSFIHERKKHPMTNQRQAALELERVERDITAGGGLRRIWCRLDETSPAASERIFSVSIDCAGIDQSTISAYLSTSSICYLAQAHFGIDTATVRKTLDGVESSYCLVAIPEE